jgi:SAM-dependent methyltransferase
MSHRHHHADGAGHHVDFDSPQMAEFAELEGEVLIDFVTTAGSVLAGLLREDGVEVGRLLDLGAGPGVGTCSLARQFPSASVVAVDGSASMLERVSARAARLGLEQRVETRLADLPGGLGTLGRADLVWMSMALHHVGDETAALGQIRHLLNPVGLLAVVERESALRVLPAHEELGRPGIWERVDAVWSAWFAGMRADLPDATTSADYPEMLQRAGFDLVVDDVLTVVLDAPLDDPARRFAHRHLVRTRERLGPDAEAADLEALDALIDEGADEAMMRRDDAVVRATRHLYVARPRPG